MAGTFSAGETKIRPGVYHRVENSGGVSLAGAVNGIGAGIIRANWGPLNTVVDMDASTEAAEIFGTGQTQDLISEMFAGGITSGKFVRIGTGGTAPKITLKNAEGENCVEIIGQYVGSRAFYASVRDNLVNENKELIIYEGSNEFLKVSFDSEGDQAQAVVDAVNTANKGFYASKVTGTLPDADPSAAAEIAAINTSADLLGKSAGELADNLRFRVVSDNKVIVTGSVKHVENYTGFSSEASEQSGFYLPFYVDAKKSGAAIKLQVGEKQPVDDSGDHQFVVLLGQTEAEGKAKNIKVIVDDVTLEFDISRLVFGTEAEQKLQDVAQQYFTGGTNPAVSAAEYSAGLSVLEAETYNVLCVDTPEPNIHTLVLAFVDRTYNAGKFPMACLAEESTTALETRLTNGAAFNSEKICYCLNAAYTADGTLYDGYRLAARIGGMIAAVSSNASLTHQVVSGFTELAEPLTNSQIEKALGRGCIVLTRNDSGQIWIEQGINTLITPDSDQDEGWKKIRRVKTRFELMQRINSTVDQLIGKVNNDNDGRAAVVAAGQGVINAMIGEKKLLTGSQMFEDTGNPPAGDSAWFAIAVDDIDSIEKVYLTYQFRFTPESK